MVDAKTVGESKGDMKAWKEFLAEAEKQLGGAIVQKWLAPLKVVHYDAGNLYLEAQDTFQAAWFEEHVRPTLQLVNNNRKKIKIHLSLPAAQTLEKSSKLRSRKSLEKSKGGGEESKSGNDRALKGKNGFASPVFSLQFDAPDPSSILSNFITCEESQLAFRVLANLVHHKDPAAPNPIFIHGPTGTGKTHLLMACANELQQQGVNAVYVRAETFTEHVVKAIRAGEMANFRQSYRNSGCLIVDDVHIFSRKSATQEEFFHTFNTLHLEGKQILLSSNCAPAALEMIEPRLVSRFEWGIVLPLGTLNLQERKHLFQRRLEELQLALPTCISDYLVETFTATPSLMRMLQALLLRTHQIKVQFEDLSLTSVKQLLSDLIIEEEKGALTPAKVIHFVASHFDIEAEELLGKAQTRECVLPRQIAMTICRTHLKLPFLKIAALFGRDHSTVMSSVKAILKGLEENDPALTIAYKSILKKF